MFMTNQSFTNLSNISCTNFTHGTPYNFTMDSIPFNQTTTPFQIHPEEDIFSNSLMSIGLIITLFFTYLHLVSDKNHLKMIIKNQQCSTKLIANMFSEFITKKKPNCLIPVEFVTEKTWESFHTFHYDIIYNYRVVPHSNFPGFFTFAIEDGYVSKFRNGNVKVVEFVFPENMPPSWIEL